MKINWIDDDDGSQENLNGKEENLNDSSKVVAAPPLSKVVADDSDDFPATIGSISIKRASDIRRLYVSIINRLQQKQIGIQRARAIVYTAHELLAVFAHVDLEERLKKLEEQNSYGRE